MNYNDFQILDDDTYRNMLSAYNSIHSLDRTTTINKIYLELKSCMNSCITITNINKKLESALTFTQSELHKILENFSISNFEDKGTKKVYRKQTPISLLKNLVSSISNLEEWRISESKEYYKNLASKTISALIKIISTILSALDESNIKFFRFM